MSAQAYKDTGLDKLTPNEVVALNATSFTARVRLSSKLANAARSTLDNVSAIESGKVNIAVGTHIAMRPRTKPYVRLSRIRLAPRVFDGEALIRPRMLDIPVVS
jgi:hypothetical protein